MSPNPPPLSLPSGVILPPPACPLVSLVSPLSPLSSLSLVCHQTSLVLSVYLPSWSQWLDCWGPGTSPYPWTDGPLPSSPPPPGPQSPAPGPPCWHPTCVPALVPESLMATTGGSMVVSGLGVMVVMMDMSMVVLLVVLQSVVVVVIIVVERVVALPVVVVEGVVALPAVVVEGVACCCSSGRGGCCTASSSRGSCCTACSSGRGVCCTATDGHSWSSPPDRRPLFLLPHRRGRSLCRSLLPYYTFLSSHLTPCPHPSWLHGSSTGQTPLPASDCLPRDQTSPVCAPAWSLLSPPLSP